MSTVTMNISLTDDLRMDFLAESGVQTTAQRSA